LQEIFIALILPGKCPGFKYRSGIGCPDGTIVVFLTASRHILGQYL